MQPKQKLSPVITTLIIIVMVGIVTTAVVIVRINLTVRLRAIRGRLKVHKTKLLMIQLTMLTKRIKTVPILKLAITSPLAEGRQLRLQ